MRHKEEEKEEIKYGIRRRKLKKMKRKKSENERKKRVKERKKRRQNKRMIKRDRGNINQWKIRTEEKYLEKENK